MTLTAGARVGAYDVIALLLSPDGTRVAVLRPVQVPEPAKAEHVVVFLQNFLDELRRRVSPPQ